MALPEKQRAAVTYRYLADLPYRDIGELIGSSAAAARRSAADGIAALRKTYQYEENS
jgi:DNA-directed RNA polymerase specialized sigma24 family protein